jgi:hypothetical protein
MMSSGYHASVNRDPFGAQPVATAPADLPPDLERYYDACGQADRLLSGGQPGDAAAAARAALVVRPRGVEAQRLLGLALLELEQARPALNAFLSVLAADPLDLTAQIGLAEAREILDGPAGAADEWRRAWELSPRMQAIGDRLQQARRAAGALDVAPGPPPLTFAALARIQLRSGLFEHAASEARTILLREPDRLDVQVLLAEAHWRSGDEEAAAGVAAQILERQSDCVAANLLLASYWHSVGRDPSTPLARIHAVDPRGIVAARLFDDRDMPWQFGPHPASTLFAAGRTEVATAVTRSLEETQPLEPVANAGTAQVQHPIVEPEPTTADLSETASLVTLPFGSPMVQEETGMTSVAPIEVDTGAPAVPLAVLARSIPVEVTQPERGISAAPVAAGPAIILPAAPENEPEPYVASADSLTRAPAAAPPAIQRVEAVVDEPVAVVPPPVVTVVTPVGVVPPPVAPVVTEVILTVSGEPEGAQPPADDIPVDAVEARRQEGNTAMREQRYLDAMRAYGTLLRTMRNQR